MKKSLPQDANPIKSQASANTQYTKGRGAQLNTANRFLKQHIEKVHIEAIDDWTEAKPNTIYIEEQAKTLVNKVDSPDVGMMYSMNPYQGCEHGCIYCYARNSFEYWGWSAGTDFESKIVVKKNAPALLKKFLQHPKWDATPISLSGNTDCYQPAEKKYLLTQQLLKVCQQYHQPVGIITKNAGILRDADLLADMAKEKLVSVLVSITSFNESLRSVMEPRTTTASQRLKVIEVLSKKGVRAGVMLGPMIPGLNDHEMQRIMKAASEAGAVFSAYTFVRLNGAVKILFHDWLYKNFPNHANKVWYLIENAHGGKVNDSRFGVRMRGEGPIADLIHQQFKKYNQLYGYNQQQWGLDGKSFKVPPKNLQQSLF